MNQNRFAPFKYVLQTEDFLSEINNLSAFDVQHRSTGKKLGCR